MDFQEQLEQLRKENEALRNSLNNVEEEKSNRKKRKKEKGKKAVAWTWKMFTGKSLHQNFNQWFTEFHNDRKVSPDTSANLLTSLVKRFVRVRLLSVILLLFSLVPSLISLYILIKQNQLIEVQNSLAEASRKSSYGFQMSNIFDAIDRRNGVIDKSLRGRIIGLSHSLKPYKILDADGELSDRLYSPERTQLLLFLLNASVDNTTLSKIYDGSDFSHCDLRNTNLSRKFLSGINLSNSNFENAELHSANLDEANLTEADLTNIQFSNGSMNNAIVTDANLENAKITRTAVKGVDFGSADNNDDATIQGK